MDTNFNNTYYYYIILFSFVILVGCFYYIYQKIKKMNDTIGQLQKHLMYQQGLIEKHNVLLRNTSQSTILTPNEITQTITPPIQPLEKEVKEETPPTEEKPNPMQTLLPMISSLMGMMNQGDEEEEYEEEDEEEEEERKSEMVKEIEKELSELKKVETELPPEGRVEENV